MGNHGFPIYEMSISVKCGWQAHSLSNSGTDGSIRMLPRRQLLADGTETDAYSGNIAKRSHAMLLAEHCDELGINLCDACQERDGRRVAALVLSKKMNIDTEGALSCGLCDAHGFLVPPKRNKDKSGADRQRLAKHSLVEFSWGLGVPEQSAESPQVFTRVGDDKGTGQMLYRRSCRSGQYGMCVRYKSVGIGVDTNRWLLVIKDDSERIRRHKAILAALLDQLLSPSGALTSTMLPHLTGVEGVIAVRNTAGRAPIYSPLQSDFIERLKSLESETCLIFPFMDVTALNICMGSLIEESYPALPKQRK